MNGLKCYLSRAETKNIVADAVGQRLQPERLLGECQSQVQIFEDGRVEVIFYNGETTAEEEAQTTETQATAKPTKRFKVTS